MEGFQRHAPEKRCFYGGDDRVRNSGISVRKRTVCAGVFQGIPQGRDDREQ